MLARICRVAIALTLALSLTGAPVSIRAEMPRFGTPGVTGDTSSDGAVITVALFATVCVVLALIGLKADIENVFTESRPGSPNPALDDVDAETLAEVKRRAALFDSRQMAQGSESDAAFSVAWHVRF